MSKSFVSFNAPSIAREVLARCERGAAGDCEWLGTWRWSFTDGSPLDVAVMVRVNEEQGLGGASIGYLRNGERVVDTVAFVRNESGWEACCHGCQAFTPVLWGFPWCCQKCHRLLREPAAGVSSVPLPLEQGTTWSSLPPKPAEMSLPAYWQAMLGVRAGKS